MTALHKPDAASQEDVKYALAPTRRRLQPINPRNYSSSKQLTSNGLDLDLTKNLHDRSKLEHLLPSIDKPQLKSHQANKLKLVNQRERYQIIRKNASLKLLKREDGLKLYNRSRADEIRPLETLGATREDKASIEAQSQNSIPLKRGQLLKRSHNYLKIGKRNELQREPQKSDVSFEDGLDKNHGEEQKVPLAIICSENLLGNGIRKYSSAKMKALVINPFERAMRHQEEARQAQSHQIPPTEALQFKESQILSQGDDNCPSTTQQQELQQLLGML